MRDDDCLDQKWDEGIVKGLTLGWGKDRAALGSGGILRGAEDSSHISALRSSPWVPLSASKCSDYGIVGCPEGLGQPQHGLCSSVVFWFFSSFLTHSLPLKLLMWGKVPRICWGWGCLGCQMSCPALQSSLWRFHECSEPQVWDQTCWDLAAILGLSGTSVFLVFFNMLLCNNPTKASPN